MNMDWLVKSEPETYSIERFERERTAVWDGVRNFEARNNLVKMKVGDRVLFYQSGKETGVAGIGKVKKLAYADPSQFDSKSEYFDRRASSDKPLWFCPEIQFVKRLPRLVSLKEIKSERRLAKMGLLKKGSRLSVHQISNSEFDVIVGMAEKPEKK